MSDKVPFLSVIDDEEDIMCLFRDALSELGEGRVFGFTDSTLALDHFKLNQKNYSLVLSDFRIPNMNGIELFKQIKDIKPLVKTVLISAFDVDDNLVKESKCVDKFLQKPIGIADLINEVDVLL